jgi:Domain of unknown function (DUF4136)
MNHRSSSGAAKLVFAAFVAVVVVGCATGPRLVSTEVTTYNEWSALPVDRSYTFGRTLEFQGSLEMKAYEDIVRDELAAQGFRLAPDAAGANLVVTLRPSVTWTRVRVRDAWPVDPFWSSYGFYGRRGYGWYGPFGGGFGGFDNFNTYDIEVFRRRLELDIDSRTTAGKRYYEGRVENSGDTASLTTVMPYLVRSLFTDFPGNNGQTRRVDVPEKPR